MHVVPKTTGSDLIRVGVKSPASSAGVSLLRAAQGIAGVLRAGASQTEVARMASGPLDYGIGMMIFKLVEKRHLDDEEVAFSALIALIGQGRSGSAPVNRRTVISNLRKIGLIDSTLSVRTIKPSGSTPNVHQIIRVTEETTGICSEEILSRNRSRPIVSARFCAMWALRSVNGTSFSMIGEHFGGKDHTTVINAVNQVNLKRLSDNAFRQCTDLIADNADLIGIRSNMDLLTRTAALRSV